MPRQIIFLLLAIALFGCMPKDKPQSLGDAASVEKAIKSGALGAEFAARANKTGNLYMREIENPGIPYKVFNFSDYQAGYSVMVENNHLVLLCAAFGGGAAKDFTIKNENGKDVLIYHFDAGSGVSRELSGQYVLGSGRAEWDSLDKANNQ